MFTLAVAKETRSEDEWKGFGAFVEMGLAVWMGIGGIVRRVLSVLICLTKTEKGETREKGRSQISSSQYVPPNNKPTPNKAMIRGRVLITN